MTDAAAAPGREAPTSLLDLDLDQRTKKRNAAEQRFRMYGIGAIGTGVLALLFLLVTILGNGVSAFQQTFITLDVTLPAERLDRAGNRDPAEMAKTTTFGYNPLLDAAMLAKIETYGIDTPLPGGALRALLSDGAASRVRTAVLANPDLLDQTVTFTFLAAADVDGYMKGRVTMESVQRDRRFGPEHLAVAQALVAEGTIEKRFNLSFITGADASDNRPEQAGIGVAMIGSFFMMLVVLFLSLPIGVAASIYLEEFAPKNRLTDLIEVNISNLAAVPSIVFGILGLSIFIQVAHLPQSAPLVGGLVLTLMTLPTIIISTRASLKAVPPSIRQAALGLGASKMQSVFHHVLPLAAPGILTGTIIGLAQALGETAPLLLIGMVGYIATNYPDGVASGLLDPNSGMPAQIYEWAKRADPAFYERAWGGIMILLAFMLTMNILAIILRRRFERRW